MLPLLIFRLPITSCCLLSTPLLYYADMPLRAMPPRFMRRQRARWRSAVPP